MDISSSPKSPSDKRGSSNVNNSNEYDEEHEAKQRWLRNQMKRRIPEFAKKQKMSIYCGTWNVNSRTFNSNLDSNNEENVTKFRDWLLPSGNESNAYDLYVIGFQEVVKLDTVNVMISNSQILERVQYWKEKIEDSLKGLDYMFVEEMHLVGLLIFVYAKNTILHNIRDVRVTTVSTGVMGIMGNKGACAIRLDYNLTSMCFICSHFQASRKKVESRNNDYHIILDKAVFLPKKKLSVANELSNTNWFTTSELSYSIWDHDVVFWLGDLNYRISSNISEEDIFNLILSDKWNSLLDNDQLLLEKSNSEVFRDFQEKEIRFPPTYKFILGTNEYDGREDKKKRPPAWCDRILYRILNGITVSVIQQEYNSYQALTISDHKPVYGTYECNISISDVIKERDVYQRLLFVLDKWENSTTPKIDLLARMINFDVVCSGSNKNIVIPIKNTGSVFAHWSFVPKNDDSNICLPWLKLAPLSGFIAPGETSCFIATILPNMVRSSLLKESSTVKLEDILIFRTINGSDNFILVSAEVNKMTLDEYDEMKETILTNDIFLSSLTLYE